MPKRVHLPDGRIVDFPDSMSPTDIQAAMVKLAGGGQTAPAPAAPQRTDAAVLSKATGIGAPHKTMRQQDIDAAQAFAQRITPVSSGGAGAGVMRAAAGATAQAVKPLIWPTRAAAGQKFQQVMGAAKDVPVDTSAAEQVASRIWDLAGGMGKVGRGHSMPKPVSDFIKRMTDPAQGPMKYEEARDFASKVGQLTARETASTSPAMYAQIHKLRIALNAANAKAAAQAGKGTEYFAAMKEYSRAAGRAKVAKKVGREAAKYGAGLVGAGTAYGILSE